MFKQLVARRSPAADRRFWLAGSFCEKDISICRRVGKRPRIKSEWKGLQIAADWQFETSAIQRKFRESQHFVFIKKA